MPSGIASRAGAIKGVSPGERLAIVVPVYNGAATVARCLTALVAEAPAGAQIVVIDDASTDETVNIVRTFPVRLVQLRPNGGASAARNAGVSLVDADIVILVDADVILRPGALAHLLAPLEDESLLGANGLFDLNLSTPGLVTAFTNTSIHYQHLRHGSRVASTFTGLCAIRRDPFLRAGGWDPRTSRFADDVGTRWHLPPESIALATCALGDHLKSVRLGGLLRHRYQVGWHFVRSLHENADSATNRPSSVLLAFRYPANSATAALSLLLLPLGALGVGLTGGLFVLINLDFALFTLRRRGVREALCAIPISALEGYAYTFGMTRSAVELLRRKLAPTPAPAR